MENKIVVSRNIKITIKTVFIFIFVTILFLFFGFFDLIALGIGDESQKGVLIFLKVMSLLLLPIMQYCLIMYGGNLFIKDPILIVDDKGITFRNSCFDKKIVISWSDVEDISVFPLGDKNHIIGLFLRNKEKYIKSKRRLASLNKKKDILGDIRIPSNYFENKLEDVMKCLKHFLEIEKEKRSYYGL